LSTLLAYRKLKGLCFKCGENWGCGHTCPTQVPIHIIEEMFAVMHVADHVKYLVLEDGDPGDGAELMAVNESADEKEHKPKRKKTIRLQGMIGKHQLQILVYSGSVAMFLSEEWVQKLQLPTSSILTSQYRAADGGLNEL
jgi:hypothetical protein